MEPCGRLNTAFKTKMAVDLTIAPKVMAALFDVSSFYFYLSLFKQILSTEEQHIDKKGINKRFSLAQDRFNLSATLIFYLIPINTIYEMQSSVPNNTIPHVPRY